MTRGQEGYVYGWQSKTGCRGQHVLDTLFVELKSPPTSVQVDGLPKNVVPVYAMTNNLCVTLPSDERYYISRMQVEVLVNFAMTDFASQGKTWPFNVADLNNLSTHQAYYTALSRSATAAGTMILQGFDVRNITGGCSGALRQEFCELELLDEITLCRYMGKLQETVYGPTRNTLIAAFRECKGIQYVPKQVHRAIWWSKQDPLVESDVYNFTGKLTTNTESGESWPAIVTVVGSQQLATVTVSDSKKCRRSDSSGTTDSSVAGSGRSSKRTKHLEDIPTRTAGTTTSSSSSSLSHNYTRSWCYRHGMEPE